MCGTAAAASSRSTVMRTISEPARASAATWPTVAFTSAVSVLVIDCTTTGAPPPTVTLPTLTGTEMRRCCGPAEFITCSVCAAWLPDRPVVVNVGAFTLLLTLAAMGADAGDLDHRRFRRESDRISGGFYRRGDFRGGRLPDRATAFADQEHHQIAGRMGVHT